MTICFVCEDRAVVYDGMCNRCGCKQRYYRDRDVLRDDPFNRIIAECESHKSVNYDPVRNQRIILHGLHG